MKPAHLLRWYPRAWRERYGEELLALIQDSLQEGRPAWRLQLSVIWGGLGQRGRQARRAAAAALKAAVSDKGFLINAAGLVCGLGLAGFTSLPSTRTWQPAALDAVLAAVALTGALVLAGGLVAFPALVRFLRAGGWPKIRRRVGWAAGVTAVAVGSGVFFSSSDWQAPNVPWTLVAALLVTIVATTVAIGLWSATATATARHLTLAPRVRAAQLIVTAVLQIAVRAMIATYALWWWAVHPSVTVLVLGLFDLVVMIVIGPERIVRAIRQSKRLRLAASGAVIINPSAHRTHGRHRALGGLHRRLEGVLAPLPEGGRGVDRVLRRADDAVVQAIVLGDHHVQHPLGHGLGRARAGELVLERLKGDLLVPHRDAEHVGGDGGQLVVG
jgi:hypothetical protein